MRAYTQHCSPPLPTAGPASEPPDDDTTDELAIFGGQTRVLALKQKQKHRRGKSASTTDSSPSPAAPALGDPTAYLAGGYEAPMGATGTRGAVDEFPWLDDLVALNPHANANINIDIDDPSMGMADIPAVS